MFTKCSHCKTTFRIHPEQLKLAAGKVRCGNCREVFNALDNLVEDVPPQAASRPADVSPPETADELMGALDDIAANTESDDLLNLLDDPALSAAGEDVLAQNSNILSRPNEMLDQFDLGQDGDADNLLGELEQFGEELDQSPARVAEDRSAASDANLFDELEQFQEERRPDDFDLDSQKNKKADDVFDIGGDLDTKDDIVSRFDLAEEPVAQDRSFAEEPVAKVEPAEKKSAKAEARKKAARQKFVSQELEGGSVVSKSVWSAVIVLLIVLLLGQVLYFKRADLIKYPALAPALEAMCGVLVAHVPCDLPLPKKLDAIVMEEREVRSHPNTPRALLISAKIVNKADFEQSYPLLELTFSDLNQKLIARRTFQPKDYLGKEVEPNERMPINVPVRVLLEIVDPGADAVNFEFNYR